MPNFGNWIAPVDAVRKGSFAGRLPHRCTVIIPGAATGVDADNQPVAGPVRTVTGVRCRFEDAPRREVVDARQAGITEVRPTLYAAVDAPVTQPARIVNITDAGGTLVEPGPFEVASVLTRRYHREIILERVS